MLDDSSHVELNAVCSTILQNKLPNKLKDPGSFTIPCLIGSLNVNNALANLRASINVMPYKTFKQLGLGKPKQTRMSIQLADRTIRFSRATARTIIDVGTGELILRVGDDTIKLQARDSAKISSNRVDYTNSINMSNLVAQHSLQETPQKNVIEPRSSSYEKNRATHAERRLQIDELDEWWTHVKEKPRIHDAKPKRFHNEHKDGTNQFKVGDKVLLDKIDHRNANSELITIGDTPFTVLNVFPYGTVEVTHSDFGTFKVNIT
ncbi:receptor-like protein kinase FERONIA [Gossypium australe]|uniref:Receptor-like protein kinase FERONIA n=1 Tax=Gossypium australe TaxID=47621 RepID=A0A5B6X0H8_9ROSI|nr:receptor-like protein kinase FERONIA [Gossypium australe]